MREFIRNITLLTKSFFTGGTVLLWYLLYALLSGGYYYVIALNLTLAIFVGMLFAFPLFYTLNVMGEQRKHRTRELHANSKYIQILVFNLKIGKNILQSYDAVLPHVDEIIRQDLLRVMDTLRFQGVLDVSHFEKYAFKTMDLFHNNLSIKATKGGMATEIFKNTTKDLTRELSHRDELSRIKAFIVLETYMMMAMAMAIPVILSYTAQLVYVPFVESTLGQSFLLMYVTVIFVIIYRKNKLRGDVEVTL